MSVKDTRAYRNIHAEFSYLRDNAATEDEYWHYDGMLHDLSVVAHEAEMRELVLTEQQTRNPAFLGDMVGWPDDDYDDDDESED